MRYAPSFSIQRKSILISAFAISSLFVSSVWAAAPQIGSSSEQCFLLENNEAMTKMMDHMSIKPTDDVDQDFVAMMVPHHQGAIEMAQAELRYGKNERLRRIAQEIVVGQQQEIVAMNVALGRQLPPSAPAPDQQSRAGCPIMPTQPMLHNNARMDMPFSAQRKP
jgi:hypothetical protein